MKHKTRDFYFLTGTRQADPDGLSIEITTYNIRWDMPGPLTHSQTWARMLSVPKVLTPCQNLPDQWVSSLSLVWGQTVLVTPVLFELLMWCMCVCVSVNKIKGHVRTCLRWCQNEINQQSKIVELQILGSRVEGWSGISLSVTNTLFQCK